MIAHRTKSPIKALVLVHENLYGGGSRQSYYILRAMARIGHRTTLVTNARDSWLGQQLDKSGLPVNTYYTSLLQRSINPFKDLAVLFYLLYVCIKERPNLLLTSGVKLMGLGSLAGWLTRIPCRVVIVRGQGVKDNTRSIYVIYALEKLVSLLGAKFITVSEYNRRQMLAAGVTSPGSICTVHNGTDIDLLRSAKSNSLRGSLNLPENSLVFGMSGRLAPQKRFDEFVKMMALLCKEYDHVYGLVIGEGTDRPMIEAEIRATGVSDRVIMCGYVPQITEIYAALDIMVLFTHYEGLPNVLLEASASGVPIIADRVCGNPEVVEHGKNGFIVEPGDLAQALAYARRLIQEPILRQSMGIQGKRIAEANFDKNTQIERLITQMMSWLPDTHSASAEIGEAAKKASLKQMQ